MEGHITSDCEDRYHDDEDDQDSYDDFQGNEDEYPIPNKAAPLTKVITKESLLTAQKEVLGTVMDLLSLREHHARTLLIHYRWDVDKIIAVLIDKGKDQLYEEAGVTTVAINDFSSQLPSTLTCNVCMEEVSVCEVTIMDCGHYFCNNCWIEYFIVKINDGQSRRMKCMAQKCNSICDEEKVRNLVGSRDLQLAERFDHFLLQSYVDDNTRIKWCPSVPHCGNAICVEEDKFCEVICACGLQFCFNCSSEAHSPCSCLMWELWCNKCQDESETSNWLTFYTRRCPKCHVLVELDGGCCVVRCVCGQKFCWLCGLAMDDKAKYETVSGHSCISYKDVGHEKVNRAKRDLKRYIHYYDLYKRHKDSFTLEYKMKETINEKISKLEERKSTYKDFSWITGGLYCLLRSRRVLMFSYPFAFNMFAADLFVDGSSQELIENKKRLFEHKQQHLETRVKNLSMLMGEPFDKYDDDGLTNFRMEVLTLSSVADHLCQALFDFIEKDLLVYIYGENHIIAPYDSNVMKNPSTLSVHWSIN